MIFTPNVKMKYFQDSFQTIETHTVGEPTRIIVTGFPELTQFGMKLLRKLNKQINVTHPKHGPSRVSNCKSFYTAEKYKF